MKYEYTQHSADVMLSRDIKREWVEAILETPSCHNVISDNEEHFFGTRDDFLGRCLKVVVNPKIDLPFILKSA